MSAYRWSYYMDVIYFTLLTLILNAKPSHMYFMLLFYLNNNTPRV